MSRTVPNSPVLSGLVGRLSRRRQGHLSGGPPTRRHGRLLTSDPSDAERATAQLLNYVAATWEKQDLPLRQHAQAVARALTR
ncbi:hypothetical protein ACWGI8_20310 [Streptomyces sp. NPDC054841]